jgi:hypothetical protein
MQIPTTHTGSLPRPDDLIQIMWAREDGVPVDAGALEARFATAVAESFVSVERPAASALPAVPVTSCTAPSVAWPWCPSDGTVEDRSESWNEVEPSRGPPTAMSSMSDGFDLASSRAAAPPVRARSVHSPAATDWWRLRLAFCKRGPSAWSWLGAWVVDG